MFTCNNYSSTEILLYKWKKLLPYFVHFVIGWVAVIGSIIVICVIQKCKESQSRSNILLSGLAGGDLATGAAFVIAAARRSILILTASECQVLSPMKCIMEAISPPIYNFGPPCSISMTVLISIDRFIATRSISQYDQMGKGFSVHGTIIVYVSSIIISGLGVFGSVLMKQDPIGAMCSGPHMFPKWHYNLVGIYQLVAGIINILVYAAAWKKLTATFRKVQSEGSQQTESLRRQIHVSKNLAIVVITTFLLATAPSGALFLIGMLNLKTAAWFNVTIPYIYALIGLNSGINVFVYAVHYKDFRQTLFQVLKIKPREQSSGTLFTHLNRASLPVPVFLNQGA